MYLGYPLLETTEGSLALDALLVSPEHGLVAFAFCDDLSNANIDKWNDAIDRHDNVTVALETCLKKYRALRDRTELKFAFQVVTVLPAKPEPPPEIKQIWNSIQQCSIEQAASMVSGFEGLDQNLVHNVESALQAVFSLKAQNPRVTDGAPDSRASVVNQIEAEIARLDLWQKQAAIEFSDGPQRVRGLAGSGKTTVLALKAANLHARNPDWTIAVTFYSRSLYSQFKDLIRRFSLNIKHDPDWEKLRILHAWGGTGRGGVYSEMAESIGCPVRSHNYGQSTFGRSRAFEGVCKELWDATAYMEIKPLYDIVLIDEAQDLPPDFFRLVYRFTRENKRICWAYDELQRLSDVSMPTTGEMFGYSQKHEPVVNLINSRWMPKQDIVLNVCYRNPSEVISVAHGLGMGIYRQEGQIQGFDDPKFWEHIGYETISGQLQPGSEVIIRRASSSHPRYFRQWLDREDIVQYKLSNYQADEVAWVANQIRINIEEGLLRPEDILIVLPRPITARKDAVELSQALQRYNVNSHLVGVTSTQDSIIRKDAVAMAHIHRAKGNEAAMVYVVHAQEYMTSLNPVRQRNSLFTAVTRSKAWVRLSGCGQGMQGLIEEIQQLENFNYELRFTLPTPKELAEIQHMHRQQSTRGQDQYTQFESDARNIIDTYARDQISWDLLPPDVRDGLRKIVLGETT